MQRAWKVFLVVLAVGVVAAAAYVIGHSDPVPGAGTVPADSAATSAAASSAAVTTSTGATSTAPTSTASTSTASTSTSATPRRSGSSSTAATSTPRTAFIGDGYTSGQGASSPASGWASLVTTQLDLTARRFAVASGGYAKPDTNGRTYLALVTAVAAFKPDLIVVSGGRNDIADDPATLRSAATKLFAQLRAALPDATIVAIAPWWGDSPHPADLATVDAAVRAGVRAVDGTYLALADPLADHPGAMADQTDPNDAGYRRIAAAVAAALKTAGLVG